MKTLLAVALVAGMSLCGLTVAAASQAKFYGAIRYALTGTPPEWSDRGESWDERHERLRPVARAIAHEAQNAGEAAALLALAQHESTLASRIQADNCRAGECDGGRARGIWQVHRSACQWGKEIFRTPPSVERLALEARCALHVYRAALERCGDGYAGGLAGYRGKCKTSDKLLRKRTYETFRHVLRHGWPEVPKGWERDPKPARADRKHATELVQALESKPGQFISMRNGIGAMVEFHWHDFGGQERPRGWHIGLSLCRRSDK